ncbi:hypothetical protein KSS87_002836 [Heliosperma pusillum]|nr:hypothetical protein KSS87_002836 [Heliosperma pusillum]
MSSVAPRNFCGLFYLTLGTPKTSSGHFCSPTPISPKIMYYILRFELVRLSNRPTF